MIKTDFPALYLAADTTSEEAQKSLLFYNKLTTFLLIAAVTASMEGTNTALPIISALCFLGSISAYFYSKNQKFQALWYQSRALAESIKTATWRLVMSAEPYDAKNEEQNLEVFRELIIELLLENKGLSNNLSDVDSQQEEITSKMLEILHSTFDEKKAIYLKERIENQKLWYSTESGNNRKNSTKYLFFTVVAYTVAIVFLLLRIANPETSFLPVDILAIIASGLIGWTDIKRYDELASAYGLTAHEIGIIRSRFQSVMTPQHLASFVKDAENAFSREHTQWAARRDI